MKFYFYLAFSIIVFLLVSPIAVSANQVRVIEFRVTSIYGQNYAAGFDRGYASAWNACRTGDELQRWIHDWSRWVIINPAYVRGYKEGVKQELQDAEYLEKENIFFSDFHK